MLRLRAGTDRLRTVRYMYDGNGDPTDTSDNAATPLESVGSDPVPTSHRPVRHIALLIPVVVGLFVAALTVSLSGTQPGSGTVKLSSSILSSELRLCAVAPMPGACLSEKITQLARTNDPRILSDQLYLYRQTYPAATGYCHDAAGVLGRLAWSKARDVDVALANGTTVCASGYLHGLQEAIGSESGGSPATVVAVLADICSQPGLVEYQVCYHGIGHALAARGVTDNSFDLSPCLTLAAAGSAVPIGTDSVYTMRELCAEGLTMMTFEPIIGTVAGLAAGGPGNDDRIAELTTERCLAAKDRDLINGCLTYVAHAFGHDRSNFDAVVRQCNTLLGVQTARCFFGLSRELAYTPEADSVESVTRYCLAAVDDTAAIDCGANTLLNRVTVINSLDDANHACLTISRSVRVDAICELVRTTQHLNPTENSRRI